MNCKKTRDIKSSKISKPVQERQSYHKKTAWVFFVVTYSVLARLNIQVEPFSRHLLRFNQFILVKKNH